MAQVIATFGADDRDRFRVPIRRGGLHGSSTRRGFPFREKNILDA